jgi:hypothetical protein
MRGILWAAMLVVGCGDPLPGDEADSCPAEYEVQACDVACSPPPEANVQFDTCATANTPFCPFACIDDGTGNGTKVCGCCNTADEGEIRALRWDPCVQ